MYTNKSDSRGFKPLLFLIVLGSVSICLAMFSHQVIFDVKIWQDQVFTEIKEHKDTADYLNKPSLTLRCKESLFRDSRLQDNQYQNKQQYSFDGFSPAKRSNWTPPANGTNTF